MAGVRIVDADLAMRLVVHEARAQQTATRELRDLGDAWLFHDTTDAEPFWNRLIAPRWPAGAAEFERRLDEVTTIFATIDRLPHVRPLPAGGEPDDLPERLLRAGFEIVGADRRMLLVDRDAARAPAARGIAPAERALGATIEVTRHGIGQREVASEARPPGERRPARARWAERRRWADDAALVLGEAFGVEPGRRIALENDVLACVSRPGCSILLVRVDGEPAAIARRATTPQGSYLSSIGTRPAFRRHGLGALATSLLVADAIDDGSELIHLAIEADNERARRLYEQLGFAVVGEPALDLLLR